MKSPQFLPKKRVTENQLMRVAGELMGELKGAQHRLVLAESCTGGKVADALTQHPGISEVFCGSAVVYRDATKGSWLNVSGKSLRKNSAVSLEVARQMALGALKRTPEANIAASVTGYLGPDIPNGKNGKPLRSKDGLVHLAVVSRMNQKKMITRTIKLSPFKNLRTALARRRQRQLVASLSVILMVRSLLQKSGS